MEDKECTKIVSREHQESTQLETDQYNEMEDEGGDNSHRSVICESSVFTPNAHGRQRKPQALDARGRRPTQPTSPSKLGSCSPLVVTKKG